jgi:hypothetical protein
MNKEHKMKKHIWLMCLLIPTNGVAADAVKVVPPQNKSLSAENGRYVFGQISEMRRDQYMLDTKTGRLWRMVVVNIGEGDKKSEVTLLEPVQYEQPDGKWAPEP